MNISDYYSSCTLCPRKCKVNRHSTFGFCREGATPTIAWYGLHKGEEYPISGEHGSGMLFFKGCSLGCSICQNNQISINSRSFTNYKLSSVEEMADMMINAQNQKAASISFVTAEHFAPHVVGAISTAREKGLVIPTVFNTSGFINKSTIDMLIPYIDIWLWDTKTLSPLVAKKYFGSELYPHSEEESLEYLCSLTDKSDMECKSPHGIIVRHLVLPHCIKESEEVIKNFAEKYKDKCYFSLMYQFIPPQNASEELKKRLTKEDAEYLENVLFENGIENGFIQELDNNEEIWRPDFNRSNPFPDGFATRL